MPRPIQRFAIALFLACAPLLQSASAQDIDFSFLSCFTKATSVSSSVTLAPSTAQVVRIGIGSQYYTDAKCYHYIVEFTVPSNAGTDLPSGFPYYTQHKVFSFDSLVNELIDTQAKCQTYAQDTIVFRKPANGNWSSLYYTTLKGQWLNGKCKVYAPSGQTDFRQETLQPNPFGTDLYRVASRVTTGSTTKVPRGVCVGLRFADIQDVPQRSCAMPE